MNYTHKAMMSDTEFILPEGFAIFVDCSFPVLILKKTVSNILHVLSNRENFVSLKGNKGGNDTGDLNSISFMVTAAMKNKDKIKSRKC